LIKAAELNPRNLLTMLSAFLSPELNVANMLFCIPVLPSSIWLPPSCSPQLFVLRKFIEYELSEIGLGSDDVYFCSLSSATVVYKGQLTPEQVSLTLLAMSHTRLDTGSLFLPCLTLDTGSLFLPCLTLDTGSLFLPCLTLDTGSLFSPCLTLDTGTHRQL